MKLPPMIAALKHHKIAVCLIALQVALTFAIVCNALFLIGEHVARMRVASGLEDGALAWVKTSGLHDGGDAGARVLSDIGALKRIPGVVSVAELNTLPLSGNDWSVDVAARPDSDQADASNVAMFVGTPGFIGTLGVPLEEGRDFLPEEYVNYSPFDDTAPPPSVIVTRTLASRLWPGEQALGKMLYLGPGAAQGIRVVGVSHDIVRSAISGTRGDREVMLLPVRRVGSGLFTVRVAAGRRDGVIGRIPTALMAENPDRIITDHTAYADTVTEYFHDDHALVWLLGSVVACLLAITALGILGLSSFWVHQRRRQIGIRRALGATRQAILRYFLAENFLIVSVGLVVGVFAAIWLNFQLGELFEIPRLPFRWLGAGILLLWALGLAAVSGPARRAARQPPIMAIRQ